MPAAAILPLIAAVLQLGMAVLMLGVSRAPGWGHARVFGLLALTCAGYSTMNLASAASAPPFWLVDWALRVNFVLGALHFALWLRFAYGGAGAEWRAMPRWARVWAVGLPAVTTVVVLSGWHVVPHSIPVLRVPALGLVYHNPEVTAVGDAVMALMILTIVPVARVFIHRARAGEPGARPQLVGFAIFFACAIEEAVVAAGLLQAPFLADVGFLAAVVPVAAATVRRVVDDARRLADASARLAGEVRSATAERDAAQSALVEAERHAVLGRLAAGVGHEINNPLTYLRLHLEEVRAWAAAHEAPPAVVESLAAVDDGAERIRRIVRDLRDTVRVAPAPAEPIALDSVLARARAIAGHHLAPVREVRLSVPPGVHVRADEGRLVQAFVNLLSNAAQAVLEHPSPERSVVSIEVTMVGDQAQVAITDSGVGMDGAQLSRLAEPFATTRAARGGTGLGLFVTRQIVDQHGGQLLVRSVPGAGTTVEVRLPLAAPGEGRPGGGTAEPGAGAPALTGEPPSAGHRWRVLVVDDDPRVTTSLARVLGHVAQVEVASGGRAALAAIEGGWTPDVIVCDLMMPDLSGMAVAEWLEARDAALRRRTLFLTGGTTSADAAAFAERPDVRVLYKPVTAEELRRAVAEVAAA
jgi:signal transduction histidine kinase/CheY-like chemotaxis protein